jgi:hypothetical protein
MLKYVKIGFTGTHSTGKSTAAEGLAQSLVQAGYPVRLITGISRNCPLPGSKKTSALAQKYIFFSQAYAETEAEADATAAYDDTASAYSYSFGLGENFFRLGTCLKDLNKDPGSMGEVKIPIILTDRTIVDNLAYLYYKRPNENCGFALESYNYLSSNECRLYRNLRSTAQDIIVPTYDIIFYTEPDGRKIKPDGTREIDEQYRNRIHWLMRDIWENMLLEMDIANKPDLYKFTDVQAAARKAIKRIAVIKGWHE